MSKRMSREEFNIEMTKLVAARSTCPRKRVGAVLLKDNHIISTGYNGAAAGMPHCEDVGCTKGPDGGCVNAVHAEVNAIAFAAKEGIATDKSTLYVSTEPCLACAKLIINAGIKEVVCLDRYRDHAGVNLLVQSGVTVLYV